MVMQKNQKNQNKTTKKTTAKKPDTKRKGCK